MLHVIHEILFIKFLLINCVWFSLVVDPVVNFLLCHCLEVGDCFELSLDLLVVLCVILVFIVLRVYFCHHDILAEPVWFSFGTLALSGYVAACLWCVLYFFDCFFCLVCCVLFGSGLLPHRVFFFVR